VASSGDELTEKDRTSSSWGGQEKIGKRGVRGRVRAELSAPKLEFLLTESATDWPLRIVQGEGKPHKERNDWSGPRALEKKH